MTLESPGSRSRRSELARLASSLAACTVLLLALPPPAAAQMVMSSIDQMRFDRPESWALKYFASATLLGGLDTPRTQRPGSVSIGFEAGWLPRLSDAQQLVGYDGTARQDLNKAPVLPLPRVAVALPGRLSLTVAGAPPVRMFGLRARLVAVALDRPVYESPTWAVGLRAMGQVGTVQGAYTCPRSVLAFEPGSKGNLEGCEAESSDTASLGYAGGQASVAFRPGPPHRFSPHAAVGLTYMRLGFQVDARTFGMIDRTRLLTHGVTVFGSGGVAYRATVRLTLGMDLFYSPLSIRRGLGTPAQNDGLFNIRALATYRLR